jgi:hypothetical protein
VRHHGDIFDRLPTRAFGARGHRSDIGGYREREPTFVGFKPCVKSKVYCKRVAAFDPGQIMAL